MPNEAEVAWLAGEFSKLGPQRLEPLLLNWRNTLLLPDQLSDNLNCCLAHQLLLHVESGIPSAIFVRKYFGVWPANTSGYPFICHICQHGFNSRGALFSHQRYMHGINPTCGCSLCNISFYHEEDMKRHNAIYHSNAIDHSSYQHICYVCFKGFSTNHGLRVHFGNMHKTT
ncbi:hypothetical protein SMQE13_09150 [Serratia marcescens]|nr:hypothetical protein SMQE13_09150 [Serratia marcescens]